MVDAFGRPALPVYSDRCAAVCLEKDIQIRLAVAVLSSQNVKDAALVGYNSHSSVVGRHEGSQGLRGGIIGQEPQRVYSLPLQVCKLILKLGYIIQIDRLPLWGCGLCGQLLKVGDFLLKHSALCLGLRLSLAQHILVNDPARLRGAPGGVPALPAAVLALAEVSLPVCSALCHGFDTSFAATQHTAEVGK